MILDNKTTEPNIERSSVTDAHASETRKVYQWIEKYTEQGEMTIVTGYFTIGALAWLSETVNDKVEHFRMVLGDIVNIGTKADRPLDLLNENIGIDAALKLKKVAQDAVNFLKLEKVELKTLEPNFCHAKVYLFNPQKRDDRLKYFITGSSNLTEAGIGLKHTNNVELNIAETGNNHQHQELVKWIDDLWKNPKAHTKKTIVEANGKKLQVDFKDYLINEISRIFVEYTPNELYYKVLFELFGKQVFEIENDPEFTRQVGRLENSVVFNSLYEFQKKGVLSLIRMLQKYNGAILADAVGLGKTWSALAVMKHYEWQGREVILLCPKKLEHNWRRYLRKHDSRFEKDQFDYAIRFHTDMQSERLDRYNDRSDLYFRDGKPKLLVIDESHNLRNDKSNRYKFLMEEILKKNEDIKVLLLSATPINNSLTDIRNQFKMMVKGDVRGFEETLDIKNLDYTFRSAQQEFNIWRSEENPTIGEFIKKLPPNFFRLTDSLIVARTRKMIEGQQAELTFPNKNKPLNLFVTPRRLGNFETFEELFAQFPPMLSGYQPSFYLEDKEENVLFDEKLRERFLVKMMYILMVKRLESSWFSFYSTLLKIRDHHQNALNRIGEYEKTKINISIQESEENLEEDEDLLEALEDFTLGKKRPVNLSDIDHAGKLKNFKDDLKTDLAYLNNLCVNMQLFDEKIAKETKRPTNFASSDEKLQELIYQINHKQKSNKNNSNQKVLIFTVYKDTAEYLFTQLSKRGFNKVAMVSGSGSRTNDSQEETKNFEPILERFAPYTKLYKEREWDFITTQKGLDAYYEWIEWIEKEDHKTYEKIKKPIDILIATDALSEGQNLQDADMVINYDIHWNPVRVIQRMGRIDRLGSPNQEISAINFWPSDNINTYLDLQGRIEQRMAMMRLAGSEVDENFSKSFERMAKSEDLDNKMKNKMMQQMQTTMEDLDTEQSFGFDDLSLETFRQDLLDAFNRDKDKYTQMPNGVYTGFKIISESCPQPGMIALLGYPRKPPKASSFEYKSYELIYISQEGNPIKMNQKEVLEALMHHKDCERDNEGLKAIDAGDGAVLQQYADALSTWIENQSATNEDQEDGSTKRTIGKATIDMLNKLKQGSKTAIEQLKEEGSVTAKYKKENFDLITWFIVN